MNLFAGEWLWHPKVVQNKDSYETAQTPKPPLFFSVSGRKRLGVFKTDCSIKIHLFCRNVHSRFRQEHNIFNLLKPFFPLSHMPLSCLIEHETCVPFGLAWL